MKKILIVEDDKELQEGISYALRQSEYIPVCADSIKGAKERLNSENVDLILLDVNLPDGEGFELCGWVKERMSIPVIFLTARDLEEDALNGYEMGADDYVTKPFSVKILLKKIDVLCSYTSKKEQDSFDDGFLSVDFKMAKVRVGGKECILTPTEYRMLCFFTEHAGVLLTYTVLLENLWDNTGAFVDKHTLAVNVNRLRRKIEDEEHKYISNVYGMGYQWIKS